MSANVLAELFGVTRDDPGRPCLILTDGTTVSYGALDERSAQLAGALLDLGCRTDDRIVVQVDKSVDAVALYLACLRQGMVFVPLNTAYTPAEVQSLVDDADPRLFVGRPHHPAPEAVTATTLGASTDGELAALAASVRPADHLVHRDHDDPAAMLYTSGTTGRSKGAVLSCRNLVSNARALVDAWRFVPDDVLVHALPIFHVHGLFVALHCAFTVGASVRFHERFEASAVRRDLRSSTVFMGVPTHYHRLLAEPDLDSEVCSAMRLFTSGSAPLPAHEHEAFAERTGHHIVERYGMTETMIVTSNPYVGERLAGTVGYALDGIEVRVTDDDGQLLGADELGSVEVRGPNVFLGYWRLPEATSASIHDGWFVTGDVGSMADDGRLTLAGRSGDVIISGGLNIYPKEIELVLDRVGGVEESAVVGMPDHDFGQAVVAVVVPAGDEVDEASLRAACDEHLARFKHPRRYVTIDSLPRNAMGKVQKAELRRMLQEPPPSG